MKATLRTSTLAAVLVAAFGAAGVALPAAAQSRYMIAPAGTAPNGYVVAPSVAPQGLVIEQFIMYGAPTYSPGELVHFRLQGTPGAQASFEVPGVLGPMWLTETRPGVYVRTVRIPPGTPRPAFFQARATLQAYGERVIARVGSGSQEARHAPRWRPASDEFAPEIVDITPDQGERVSERGWTRIRARVADRGTGVQSIDLRVDGRDVSDRVRFDGDDVRYAEDLAPGRHVAELAVRDRAGNVTRRAWSFVVVDEGRRYGWGYGGGYGYSRW